MPFIEINKINLYYETHGKGSPLLFLSGFASHHQSWLPYINYFSKTNQVIVFHNRGSGQTDAPPSLYTMDLLASDTLALLDSLNIPCADMIGSSMGAAIVMTIAQTHPKRIKKGVLIAPFPKLPLKTLLHSKALGKLIQAKAPLPLSLIHI